MRESLKYSAVLLQESSQGLHREWRCFAVLCRRSHHERRKFLAEELGSELMYSGLACDGLQQLAHPLQQLSLPLVEPSPRAFPP